jgi:hypothetical protein
MRTVEVGQHKLELSESHIRYGGYEIPLDQVRGLNVIRSVEGVRERFGWGLAILSNPVLMIPLFAALVGPSSRRASIAPARFIGVRGDSQSLRINCGWAFADLEELDALFKSVFDSIWQAAGERLTAKLISDLEKGETVTVGGISICRDGVWLYGKRSFLSWMDKPALVPWHDIKTTEVETELCIQSISDPSRRGILTVNNVENGTVMEAALRHLLQDNNWKKLCGRAEAQPLLN